jgi:DNA invertase Pin-like site-specific DNA recombinase
MAEDERKRIVTQRLREGLDAARERGPKFGRKPKLTAWQHSCRAGW